MAKRALIEQRPWLLASIAAAVAFYFLRDNPVGEGTWGIALKGASVGLLALYALLRVPQGKWRVKMFQAYGANPSPMALSEVFVALQTGVMDGQENPLTQIYSSKFQEVQKFLSMTGHVYTPAYLVSGARRFGSLPADVQAALSAAAKETQAYVYAQAAKLDDELLGKIKAAGV